jgi:hypothetical protein
MTQGMLWLKAFPLKPSRIPSDLSPRGAGDNVVELSANRHPCERGNTGFCRFLDLPDFAMAKFGQQHWDRAMPNPDPSTQSHVKTREGYGRFSGNRLCLSNCLAKIFCDFGGY